MKKKDLFLVGLILAAAVILYIVNSLLPKRTIEGRTAEITMAPDAVTYSEAVSDDTSSAPQPSETSQPTAADETDVSAKQQNQAAAGPAGPMMPQAQNASDVKGHVIITLNGRQYGDPIPMDRDKIITIRQDDEKINKIHITPDSVVMESSTCENQDCVGEGEITLENYKTRILSTYIICLPNGVQIEMVPVEQ